LKPDNILVFEGGGTFVLKLADVGLAVEVQQSVRAYTCTSSSFS
jgi:serine/threonine protein kinase